MEDRLCCRGMMKACVSRMKSVVRGQERGVRTVGDREG